MATAKQLDDVMKCPICIEVFTDPRVLPCVHTYCLRCIKAWSDKQSGDELACPLCRKEFTLPSSGVEGLPKNFYVANFLQMKELSIAESTTSPCEACSGIEESEFERQNVASVYCVECQMKLCKICEQGHKMIRLTCSHKLIQIGEHIDADILYKSMPPAKCDQHKDENLKLYCFECKSAICMMCFAVEHQCHKCSEIKKVKDDFQKQMAVDVDSIAVSVDRCREMWESVEKEKSELVEQVEKAGVEISQKADQLKRMIDDHREKLMSELSLMKQKRMKEIESVREEIERQLLSMESYKMYVDEVRQKGTACDIARAANGLHDRAEELLKFDAIERALDDLGHTDVMFASSDFVVDDVGKTLGQLKVKLTGKAINLNALSLKHAIPSRGYVVSSLASLGDKVFGARQNGQHIDVYDATTFAFQHNLPVPGHGQYCSGLAACSSNNCLYASDGQYSRIHRVDLSDSSAVKQWSVANGPRGLSVNKEHNVVVACVSAHKLQEYTMHGTFVREISLQQVGVFSPFHAIQLSTGDYVFSQDPGAVSVVGVDGQVVRSYDQSQASNVGPMKCPRSVAVTKNDNILVADYSNHRILSLDSSLSCAQVLALSVDSGLQLPLGMCLDETRGRLYISECAGGCRVLVFESTE